MSEDRIFLLLDNGKKGINLPLDIYSKFRDVIIESFLKQPVATQMEITHHVSQVLAGKFDGDIAWHVEIIVLDLIARNYIENIPASKPPKFRLKFFIC